MVPICLLQNRYFLHRREASDGSQGLIYMFITKQVFLAHSEIEDGAQSMGLSMTIFKKPVEFITLDGKQRFAKIILMLSAQDQKSHIRLLNDIMTIFSEQKNEEKLWGQKEILDVKNVLYELLQEEK